MSTERTQSSEATEAPTVASGDEEGMLARLNAMGIGQAAVQHVVWVNDARNSSHRDSRASSVTQGPDDEGDTLDGTGPDGLVPLRNGEIHWAGLPIPTAPRPREQHKDPIVELLACRDKEVRRVILWSRRRLDKSVLWRMLRYSINEAEFMERLWQPPTPSGAPGTPSQAAPSASGQGRRQLFAFAGDAAMMRARWAEMNPREQKEFCRLDSGRNQRDLMERIIQGFGYAPRPVPTAGLRLWVGPGHMARFVRSVLDGCLICRPLRLWRQKLVSRGPSRGDRWRQACVARHSASPGAGPARDPLSPGLRLSLGLRVIRCRSFPAHRRVIRC